MLIKMMVMLKKKNILNGKLKIGIRFLRINIVLNLMLVVINGKYLLYILYYHIDIYC